ncbi:succinylglutamate desuccinylase/aspartoacylase family protein [Haloparvum sedimenti]|uniref:succinylglutamate desuccinylase/aspartoacylase family protein n=1 Tax=Haloparvum sedimenti TaxID=1678448 RepID=UPI00071E786C|nr:succinylglutamate desuccinylase/aspartoacylase family protein [Haloparvum sedimenti]
MHLGTAEAAPGELARGWLDVTDLPTGGAERLPVLIANGVDDGPTLWLTGGVHGDEATGVAVAQDAMREDLPERLAGAVVCVPVASPAGLRRNARHTYYGDDDPNRHFPDAERDASRPPEVQERIDRRLYEAIVGEPAPGGDDGEAENDDEGTEVGDDLSVDASPEVAADALIDLHTAGVGSVPFTIRDRVLYGERRTEAEAETLAADLDRLADAFGFPVLTEYPAEEYLDQRLQRSTAGAALNTGGVPAITVELGAHSVVEEDTRAAGVAGVYAVAAEFGLLDAADVPDDLPAPGEGVPDAPVDFPVRRFRGPRTETAGLIRHRVAAGDAVAAGDTVADVVSPTGEPRAEVTVDRDGYVLGRAEGLAAYEGDAVASLAVRDDGDLVVPRDANED